MQRVMIIGSPGSGKSTLARELRALTGLPIIHLDQNYFGPNWAIPETPVWEERVRGLIAQDRWIMDGNYGGTHEMRFARADTIILLDLPTWTCLRRVIWRSLTSFGKKRPDMAEGCREKIDFSFFRYVYNFRRTRSAKLTARLEALKAEKNVHILSSKAAVREFLSTVKTSGHSSE